MSRIRVLQAIESLAVAGAETMVTQLAIAMDRSRFDVAVLTLFDSSTSPLHAQLRSAGIEVHSAGKRLGLDLRTLWRVGQVVRRLGPDVVHTHMGALRYVLPWVLARRCPTVHTMHIVAEHHRTAPWITRAAFALGVQPVGVSRAVSESITREYGVRDVPVIDNGIPVGRYRSPEVPRVEWRRRAGVPESAFAFVNVARFMKQKNHLLLIESFARAFARHPETRLLLAGEGPLQEEARRRAADLGVAEAVVFLGLRRDVPELLAASDVFAMASDYEGNPLSVLEAMAAGLPVVSTAVGGIPELVEDGRSGILVKAGDGEALSRAMIRLLDAPDETAALGARSAETAAARFDVSVMARAYEALFERLVAPSRASRPAAS